MDEQVLEARGIAALGERRKMLKTFKVVKRKMVRWRHRPHRNRLVRPRRRRHLLFGSSNGSGGGMPSA